MDAETIRWGLTGLFGIIVWFCRSAITSNQKNIDTLHEELNKVKINYLHRDDFKDFKAELRLMFEEIKSNIKSLSKE